MLDRTTRMPHRHQVFGLTLESELACPELVTAAPEVAVDIQIRIAPLTAQLDSPSLNTDQVQVAPGIYQFLIRDVTRYRVERGE